MLALMRARFYKSDYFLAHVIFIFFVYTSTFGMDPTHSFINEAPGLGLGLQLSTLHPEGVPKRGGRGAGLDTAGNVPLKLIVSAGPDHTHVHINAQTK